MVGVSLIEQNTTVVTEMLDPRDGVFVKED